MGSFRRTYDTRNGVLGFPALRTGQPKLISVTVTYLKEHK